MTIGASRTYYQKWRFKVLVDGFPVEAFFQKAGPLEGEVETAEYRGGGDIIPHKEAGAGSFPVLTLERGSTEDQLLYEWFKQVIFAGANSGENQSGYKRNLSIVQMDRLGNPVKIYTIFDAFVKKYTAGDWDGTATSDFSMNVVDLEYAYFEEQTIPSAI